MRKVKLYIAMSLDGKIADAEGGVKWLEEIPNPNKLDYEYIHFQSTIDTTLMGHRTYQQIMSFGIDFPYPDTTNFVFTQQENKAPTEDVIFQSGDIVSFVKNLKAQSGKDIWLIGGASINQVLFQAQLIDEIWLFLMPIVVGNGVPLFTNLTMQKQLQLVASKSYPTGVVSLRYVLAK